jgi:hypothetical protein
MNDEPVSWGSTLRVYWLIVWRTLAMYTIVYAPFALWRMASDDRLNDPDYLALSVGLAWLLLLGGGFIAMKMAFRKRYRGFRIQIIRDPVS